MTQTRHVTSDLVSASVAAYTDHSTAYATYNEDRMVRQATQFLGGLEPADDVILDAGCGPGRDLVRFAKAGHCAVGIDLNPAFVDLARAATTDLPVHVDQGDLRDLPYDDARFAGVWACASLVHLDSTGTRTVLGEFHRVLDTDGRLYVSVKVAGETGWVDTDHGRRWFQIWDPQVFTDLVAGAGFRIDWAQVDGVFIDVWATKR